jgi:amino acid transporter
MENLFSPSYWFDLTPVRLSSGFEVGFFVLFAVMIVAGLAFRIVRKNRQDKFERIVLERATVLSLTTGFLGLLWLFLTFEEISIFGARFWFLILVFIFVFMLVRLIRYKRIQVPQLRLLEQSKAEVNKYLPRRR